MNRRTTFQLVGFALCAAVALAGCGKGRSAARPSAESPAKGAKAEEPATPERVRLTAAAIAEAGITTWKVQVVDLSHLLSLNGSVGYNENRLLQVAANVKGRVASIPVDLGARVKAGDPLLVIESVELGRTREEFAKELSSFNVSASAYERAKKLVEANAISAGEFQAREGDYLAKKAAVASAERTLHLYGDSEEAVARLRANAGAGTHSAADGATLTLRAPFAGRVIDRKVTPGALFEALQPLMTVADLGSVWVFLNAYEKDLALLHEGLPVTLRTDAYPQKTFRGRVDFLGSVIDPQTRSVRLRATVENREGKLRPGLFVKAQLDVPKPQSEARPIVAVPQAALQTLEGRTTVFVQVEPGVFARHHVEVGHSFEGFTEILAGIRPGDDVATEGSFVLKSEFAKASLKEGD
jgi:cobalt-zinc-cadmium efflux system membrane fusion protein